MSNTLDKMLLTRRGYRTESYSGSGVRDLRAVLKHELSVLGNSDVLAYCNLHYFAGFNITAGASFSNNLSTNADAYVQQIEQLVRSRLRTKRSLYAIWLTTKDNVRKFYGGSDGDISYYQIPEVLVLSDLGPEGALFVYQRHPSAYLQGHQYKQKNIAMVTSFWRWCVELILTALQGRASRRR